MAQNTTSHVITLKDGRKLGYAVLEAPDLALSAPTVLFLHGWPGSYPEGGMIKSQVLKSRIRLITLSRPGFGDSSLQPHRTHLDWPDDVLEFVDHISVKQFYVLGFSGGCPYALACLVSIPPDRLLGAAVVAGACPGCLSSKDTLFINKLIGWASRSPVLPSILPFAAEIFVGREARNPQKALQFERRFVKDVGARHSKEAESLENVEVRTAAVESCRQAFKQDSRGWACEAKLLNEDWGIPFEKIDGTRLDVWHGREDKNVSHELMTEMTNALKGCEVHLVDGEAHVSLLVNHAGEILGRLLEHR